MVYSSDPESDDVAMEIDPDGTGGDFEPTQVAIIQGTGELDAQFPFDSGLLIG